MGGHYVGKIFIAVSLTDGREGFVMEIVDDTIMICDDYDSAARFITVKQATNFIKKNLKLPNFFDRNVFIESYRIVKENEL